MIEQAEHGLLFHAQGYISRNLDPIRLCRIVALVQPDINNTEKGSYQSLCNYVLCKAQDDYAWSNNEETLWCITALKELHLTHTFPLEKSTEWLKNQKISKSGWGNSMRDYPRITTTSLVLTLLPEIGDDDAFSFIEEEWSKDYYSEVKLTYKGAFTLMAFGRNKMSPMNPELVNATIGHIRNEQNDDGGFGPWKGHPIGSDPWSTGICLVGLCSYPEIVDRYVVERASDYLCKTQLPTGLWPYHFIDEGSAYAYWGLKEAAAYLERR